MRTETTRCDDANRTATYPNPAQLAHHEKKSGIPNVVSADERKPVTITGPPAPIFPPLELVNRPTVPTDQAAFYLMRQPQTLRGWASAETFPPGLRPVRIQGRLGWPVAGIKAALGVS